MGVILWSLSINHTTLALSNQAVQNLAKALMPSVIDYITNDSGWVEYLQEAIPEAIVYEMGDINETLHFEISSFIMDKIIVATSETGTIS